MLANAWVRFGLFLIVLGLCLAQGRPDHRDEAPAHGRQLVGEFVLPAQTVQRYADMAAGRAQPVERRDGSRFADAAPWLGAMQVVGTGHNPYTLVFTVRGTSREAGPVFAQWQAGWEVEEEMGARREVAMDVPALSSKVQRAGDAVRLTGVSERVSFRGQRTVAPKLGLVLARNLDIRDVQVQVWSGSAPFAWPVLPPSSMALCVFGALCLVLGMFVGGSGGAGWSPGAPAQRCRRIELPTTSSELAAMPRPAAQGGKAPNKASGTHTRL
jgi:hypothetical protein